jgi:hypothetical protein
VTATAPRFAVAPYAPYGAVHTFPVWGPTLASAFDRACTGTDIALDVNGIVGEQTPTLHWCPATRRVTLWGVAQIDVDMVPGGVPVGSALLEVFQVPAEFCSPVKRLGAAPTSGGWVRWDLTPPTSANTPGSFGIRELPPAAFPAVHLGGVLQFASITLTGITWRVPRT